MGENRQSLDDFVEVVRRFWWVVLMSTVVSAAAMYVFSSARGDVFLSTVKIELRDLSSDSAGTEDRTMQDPERVRQTQIQIIQSNQLEDQLRTSLAARGDQLETVSARGVGATDIIEVSVTASAPEVARDAATALAQMYIDDLTSQAVASLTQRSGQISARIESARAELIEIERSLEDDDLPAEQEVELRSTRDDLLLQLSDLRKLFDQIEIESALRDRPARVVESAQLPEGPVQPRPARDAVLIGMIVAMFTTGAVLLRFRLDDRVRSADDIRLIDPGLRVLASIPAVASLEVGIPPRSLIDAFRDLRSNVATFSLGRTASQIVVMSPDAASGKTTATALLGRVLAASGRKVILVDGDIRRPQLHRHFGLPSDEGITTALARREPLMNALRVVQVTEHITVGVVPAGPVPTNPGDVVASEHFSALLARAKTRASIVLVDSPPCGLVADAFVLARQADGIILLARAGHTRRSSLRQALEGLQASNANVLGVVITFARGRAEYGYYASPESDAVDQSDIEAALTVQPGPTVLVRGSGTRSRVAGTAQVAQPEGRSPDPGPSA